MLTDPPQRVVSVTCRGITHNSLTVLWSDPLKSYESETFVGFRVRFQNPVQTRHICTEQEKDKQFNAVSMFNALLNKYDSLKRKKTTHTILDKTNIISSRC